MTLDDILEALRRLAPEETALDRDPVGLLVDRQAREAARVGVCLDCTPAAVARAVKAGAEMVVAHHPLIYHPLKRLGTDPVSQAVAGLIRADMALYVMHTNWDRAEGGINDTLAECLQLENVRPLGTEGEAALPRLGDLAAPRPLTDFARFVESALGCAGTSALRVSETNSSQMISRVAVCGGAGAGLASALQAAGAQAYVTSDVRHSEFWEAEASGLALLDAGHGATERPGMRALCRTLPGLLDGVEVLWVGE